METGGDRRGSDMPSPAAAGIHRNKCKTRGRACLPLAGWLASPAHRKGKGGRGRRLEFTREEAFGAPLRKLVHV